MSDPIVKGAKRNTSRPAPQSASTKSSAKGKTTTTAARPKPQRAAAEKAPVRKAAPAKSARTSAKSSAKPAAKTAPKKSQSAAVAKKSAAKPKSAPARTAAVGKSARPKATAKPQPKKAAARPQSAKATSAKATTAAKPQPAKTTSKPTAPQTAKPSRTATPHASTGKAPAKAAQRPAPAPPRQPSRDEAAALKAFERAHKEFTRGRFETARDLFRALIVQHAGVSEVTARARTYLNIAESRLRQEAALPRDADALYDRGVFEMNRGDYVAAQEMFERALKRDDSAADTHYALAAARSRLGAIETAIQALEHAIDLNPRLRLRAQNDLDFVTLRNEPEFERIVFAGSRV